MQQCPKCGKEYPKGVGFCPRDGAKTISRSQAPVGNEGGASKRIRLQVGNYTLIRKLGEGGMGVVFEAEHKLIQKRVALKMLHADKANDKQISSRFVREAKISSQIKNPHIVDITDFGETEKGDLYLVMEYLEGKDLGHYLEARGHLKLAEAQHILLQVAQALAAAHKAGVIHRDLKPDNIFLINKEGDPRYVKLLDFGIAKLAEGGGGLTKAGMIIGTPEYMSPEQCEGKPVDPRSDIYSFGVIAYQMFTGRVPFAHEHFSRVLLMHSNEPPVPPRKLRPDLRIPVAVEATILKCLEKHPEDRYQSMGEVIAALSRWGDENTTLLDDLDDDATHTLIASSPVLAAQASAPLPTLNLEGAILEDVDDEEATQAVGAVLNLSHSMIEDAPTMLPADLGTAETITPGMLQRPPQAAPSPRPVGPSPVPSPAQRGQPPTPETHSQKPAPQAIIATETLPRVVEPAPTPGRSRLGVIIGSAVGASAVAALFLYALLGNSEPAKTPPPASQPAPPPATLAASQPEKPAPPPEVTEMITLSVKARPATGVEVRVAGEDKLLGTLPDDILLPKGKKEITLEFSKKGYLTVSKNITPDQDQKIKVMLSQERKKPEPSPNGIQNPFEKK